VTTAKISNSAEISASSLSNPKILFPNLFLTIDGDKYGVISREKGNCKCQSIFLDVLLKEECSNRLICNDKTSGSLLIDICFNESLFS
jgi:hypothetical protein